nr:hypothetical protein Iba_chr05eCG15890 [Ipomoea batatas]
MLMRKERCSLLDMKRRHAHEEDLGPVRIHIFVDPLRPSAQHLPNFHGESVHPPNVCVEDEIIHIFPVLAMFLDGLGHDNPVIAGRNLRGVFRYRQSGGCFLNFRLPAFVGGDRELGDGFDVLVVHETPEDENGENYREDVEVAVLPAAALHVEERFPAAVKRMHEN